MAIKTKAELLDALNGILGESRTDEAITFLEDMTDTMDDYEKRTTNTTSDEEWQRKMDEADKAWREKYYKRFFSGDDPDNPTHPPKPDEKPEPMRYEDLFNIESE